MVAGQFASALVALGIAVSITKGAISWIFLFVAALFQGLVLALITLCYLFMTPRIRRLDEADRRAAERLEARRLLR